MKAIFKKIDGLLNVKSTNSYSDRFLSQYATSPSCDLVIKFLDTQSLALENYSTKELHQITPDDMYHMCVDPNKSQDKIKRSQCPEENVSSTTGSSSSSSCNSSSAKLFGKLIVIRTN